MKLTPCNLLLPLLVMFSALAAHARTVTLVVNHITHDGPLIYVRTLDVGPDETAKLVSLRGAYGSVRVVKDGVTNSAAWSPCTIAGPAQIILDSGTRQPDGNGAQMMLTVEIAPESFPPGQTIIIPQGTPGANIIMEASGDLVHWTNAPPGLYTNTEPSHLFFRLRADRL